MEKAVLSLVVENHANVLARVASLSAAGDLILTA